MKPEVSNTKTLQVRMRRHLKKHVFPEMVPPRCSPNPKDHRAQTLSASNSHLGIPSLNPSTSVDFMRQYHQTIACHVWNNLSVGPVQQISEIQSQELSLPPEAFNNLESEAKTSPRLTIWSKSPGLNATKASLNQVLGSLQAKRYLARPLDSR